MKQYFHEADMLEEDVRKNVQQILKIRKGSIPLARGMGTDYAFVSQIAPELENDYSVDVIQAVADYEPRAAVEEVNFSYSEDGEVNVSISLVKGVGYDE